MGDIVFFIGVGVITNSAYLWIAHLLLGLWFAVAPLTEEPGWRSSTAMRIGSI